MITKTVGLVPTDTTGLHAHRQENVMAQLPGGDESIYLKGAQDPQVAPNQKGHGEAASPGSGSASSGRNDPMPASHPLTGTTLPQGTEAGSDPGRGTIMKGGRAVRG
jgi:hypothetical protein